MKRELLACYLSIKHFRWMLEARPIHVWTDHKPLVFALKNASEGRSARQLHHLSFVAEFTSDVRHVAGKVNVVVDALSRPAAVVAPTPSGGVAWAALAREQKDCAATRQLASSGSLQV